MADTTTLTDEEQKKKDEETAAYAAQLYGTDTSAANVSASSDAASSDYSNYVTAQNAELSGNTDNDTTTASTADTSASNTAATIAANTAGSATTGTTTADTTTANNTAATTAAAVDYSGLSEYDQKLSDDAKNQILQYQQAWKDAKAKNDTAAMKEAYIQAQLVRAKNGGYISSTADGTGYTSFGYGNLSLADRSLPQAAQDEILYWQLQYQNANNDTDKTYAHDQANAVRSKYGGYTSTDGNNYTKDTVDVNDQYSDDSTYTNPYANETATLTDYLSNDTGWDASSYNPATDAAYQAYADYYNRNGSAAANSALAQAAGNTGGIANSYATALAAAAQQSYAKQLTDVIPTLQANAQTAYNNNITNKQALLNELNTMNDTSYNQYNTNRTFDYNTWLQNWTNAYNMYNLNNTNNQNATDRDWQSQQNELDREQDRYLASLS